MSKKAKTSHYIIKGITVVAALLAALLLIAPFVASDIVSSASMNIFDGWDIGLKNAPADYAIMLVCYSIVFFLGLIVAVLALLSIFVDNKLISQLIKVLAIVLAVLAVVGLICNFVYIGDANTVSVGAGGIVSTIFAVVTAAMVYAEKALK